MEALQAHLLAQGEYLLRILLAALCGALVGLERSRRQKEAGIRTHLILAMGAALMMVLSKYGFNDVVVLHDVSLDPSRIAANVITGVSFLGAGVIFVRGGSVKGLTTAAGIWATTGMGLAFGAGMYLLAFAATGLIIAAQLMLHRYVPPFELMFSAQVSVVFTDETETLSHLRDRLTASGFIIQTMSASTQSGLSAEFILRYPHQSDLERLLFLLEQQKEIKSFSIQS